MSDVSTILRHNLAELRKGVAAACQRSNRPEDAVRLVAITKYAEWPWVLELSRLHNVFGENRPQQLSERQMLLPGVEWHLTGQLQRNKVRLALAHAALIHSVDSFRLLAKLSETAVQMAVRPRLLLQVNVSGESTKSGFTPAELLSRWSDIAAFTDSVSLDGLMTMAEEADNPEYARPVFRQLRVFRDQLIAEPNSRDRGITLPQLSMGMSGDFVPAVEEGATLIRIGSRIFDGLAPMESP